MKKTKKRASIISNFLYFKFSLITAILIVIFNLIKENWAMSSLLFSILLIINIIFRYKGVKIDNFAINFLYPINLDFDQEDMDALKNYLYKINLYDEINYLPKISYPANEKIGGERQRHAPIKNVLKKLKKEFLKNKSNGLLVTVKGEPGIGKSSLLFELFRYCHLEIENGHNGWIPVFILGRNIDWSIFEKLNDKKKAMRDFINLYFSHLGTEYDGIKKIMDYNYKKYRFLFIIDGLDEIPDYEHYSTIIYKLENLIKNDINYRKELQRSEFGHEYKDNRYIISFRQINNFSCFRDEDTEIGRVKRYELIPINYQKAKNYLPKLHDSLFESCLCNLKSSISNPYLLSLIRKYWYENYAPEINLEKIYTAALKRELAKFNTKNNRTEVKFIVSLIAPFCYFKTLNDLSCNHRQKMKLIESYFQIFLEKEPKLSHLLFDKRGYFKLIYKKEYYKELHKELTEIWGESISTEFEELLKMKRKNEGNYDFYVQDGIHFLFKKITNLLSESNLIVFGKQEFAISLFRNKFIQDYFTALYIKAVDRKNDEHKILIQLFNTHNQDIINILAALTEKHPKDLLKIP